MFTFPKKKKRNNNKLHFIYVAISINQQKKGFMMEKFQKTFKKLIKNFGLFFNFCNFP